MFLLTVNSLVIGMVLQLATVDLQKTLAGFSSHSHMLTADSDGGVQWGQGSLRRISETRFGYACYPRMIELSDGVLLCVHEADGSVFSTTSKDGGESWEKPVAVAWSDEGISMAAPDVLQLQDGSVLACYNVRPYKISRQRTFGIRTRKSYDGGKTWTHGRLLYEGGHRFGDGCWEPCAIQLPDGQVQVYFADEGKFRRTSDQCISMVKSSDSGRSWSEFPQMVSYRPFARDGMPVPLLLHGGAEIACAIEDKGWWGNFKPAIVRSPVENAWAQPVKAYSSRRQQALAEPLPYKTYAGAPYLRQAKSGETLLSYQGTEGRRNSMYYADMKVMVGDDKARSFSQKTIPFKVPRDRYALWNSLTVLADGSVVALTSTNAFADRQQVWMIKGRLKN